MNNNDNCIIALVWSFSDDFQETPYSVSRVGSAKKSGGTGVQWKCTCPAFTNRGGKICKHITSLVQGSKSKDILNDKRFNITPFGRQVLNLERL
jgi:hypothetical protein